MEMSLHMIRRYVIGVLFCFMLTVSVLLVVEYRFLKQKLAEVVALQQEYREHLSTVKSFLDKCKNDKLFSGGPDEGDESSISFPDGAKIFSLDDQDSDPFVVVDRSADYLKESAILYLKEQLDASVPQLASMNLVDMPVQKKNQNRQKIKTAGSKNKSLPLVVKSFSRLLQKESGSRKDINLIWPIERSSFWISSLYGRRRKANRSWGFHHGLDMAAMRGTKVKAVASGIVTEASYNSGYGKNIVITHNKKYKTRYAHLSSIGVRVGQKVTQGRVIGRVGATGLIRKKGKDGSHLHFEVSVFGKHVNPLRILL